MCKREKVYAAESKPKQMVSANYDRLPAKEKILNVDVGEYVCSIIVSVSHVVSLQKDIEITFHVKNLLNYLNYIQLELDGGDAACELPPNGSATITRYIKSYKESDLLKGKIHCILKCDITNPFGVVFQARWTRHDFRYANFDRCDQFDKRLLA